jgi:hypothetical protein
MIVMCAEGLSGASADAMMSMLQNLQVNSEDRDVAIRLLKTGKCAGNSIHPVSQPTYFCVCYVWKHGRKSQQFKITYSQLYFSLRKYETVTQANEVLW